MKLTNISAKGGTFLRSSIDINPSLSQYFENSDCIAGKSSATTKSSLETDNTQ